MKRLAFALGCVGFSIALAAPGGGGCGGGGGTSSGGTTGSSGGTGGGTTTTGGSGGTAGEPYGGFVIFGAVSEPGGSTVYDGQAGFYTAFTYTCAGGTQSGSCCYQSTAAAQAEGKTVPQGVLPAGTITLADGSTTLGTLPFVAGKGYSPLSSTQTSSFKWNPGDTLGVTAAGDSSAVDGGIDAFSSTVVAPSNLMGLTPALAGITTLARSSDLALTWTPGGSQKVTVNLLAFSSGDGGTAAGDGEIICTVDNSSGSLDIPAALLGNFPSGATASLELTVANDATPSVGNATVGVTAEISATTSLSVQ